MEKILENKENITDIERDSFGTEVGQHKNLKIEQVKVNMTTKEYNSYKQSMDYHGFKSMSETILHYANIGRKREKKKVDVTLPKVDKLKLQQGVEYIKKLFNSDNPNWNAIYFGRYVKTIKELLILCNQNIERVKEALDWSNGYAKRKGFFWKPENTVTYFNLFEKQVPEQIKEVDFKTMAEKLGFVKPMSKAEAIQKGLIKNDMA